MPTTLESPLMTTADLLALPESEAIERDLIRGRLVEGPMSRRNYAHARTMAKVGSLLDQWNQGRPAPRGVVLAGDAAFRLRQDPDTTVGIDIAYISAGLAAQLTEKTFVIEGRPALAVEILSPSDTVERLTEKVQAYLDAEVPRIWVIFPHFRLVHVHRPGASVEAFNATQALDGGEELPGLSVPVAALFEP